MRNVPRSSKWRGYGEPLDVYRTYYAQRLYSLEAFDKWANVKRKTCNMFIATPTVVGRDVRLKYIHGKLVSARTNTLIKKLISIDILPLVGKIKSVPKTITTDAAVVTIDVVLTFSRHTLRSVFERVYAGVVPSLRPDVSINIIHNIVRRQITDPIILSMMHVVPVRVVNTLTIGLNTLAQMWDFLEINGFTIDKEYWIKTAEPEQIRAFYFKLQNRRFAKYTYSGISISIDEFGRKIKPGVNEPFVTRRMPFPSYSDGGIGECTSNTFVKGLKNIVVTEES